MKNPYGKKDGQLVIASEVERGLSCGCLCPACDHQLQAHQGSIRTPYFSHYRGSDCGVGYETALHLLAKEILLEEKKILLPELKVSSESSIVLEGTFRETEVLVKPWTRITLDSVTLEKKIGRIIPDVIAKKNNRVLLVEIKVTHGIEDEKLAYIKRENLNVVEYDFSKARGIVEKKHIKQVLTKSYKGAKKGLGRGQWIHHYMMQETLEKLNQKYIDNNSRCQIEEKHESKSSYLYKPYR
jgi:hypothetical protein